MLEYVSLFFHNFYSNQSFNQISLPYYTGLIYHTHRKNKEAANSGFFCFAARGKRFFLLFLYDVEVTEGVQDAVFVY